MADHTPIVVPDEYLKKAGYATSMVVITCGAPCGRYLAIGSGDYRTAAVTADWGTAKIPGEEPEKWYYPLHVQALRDAVEAT